MVARTIYSILTYRMATVSKTRPPHNHWKKWAGPEIEKYLKLKSTNSNRHMPNKTYIPPILYIIDINTGSGKNLNSFVCFDILKVSYQIVY
jgi:hypothetical protein